MKNNLDSSTKQQIISLYKEGESLSNIRSILNLKNIQPITNLLKKEGLRLVENSPKRRFLYSEENITRILELRQQGLATDKIGELVGVHHQCITNILKKNDNYTKLITITRKYTLNEDYFNLINCEEKAYIIGFICADGSICRNTNRVIINISQKDLEIIEKIKSCLGSNGEYRLYKAKNPYLKGKDFCEMVTIGFNSKKLVESLSFIPENKTYTLTSKVVEVIPKELIRHFMRGYFDGDGNVIWNKKYSSGIKYNINVCGNEEFLLNVFNKNFPSTNKMYKDKKAKQCFVWKISSKEKVKSFLEYLYKDSTLYLQRKYNIYIESQHAHIKPIELSGNPNK